MEHALSPYLYWILPLDPIGTACRPARKLSCSRCGHHAVICRDILSAFPCMADAWLRHLLRACCVHSAVNWRQRTWSSRHLVGCRGAQFCGRCLPFARSASRVLDEASACFRRGGGRLAALATFFVTRAKQAGCLGRIARSAFLCCRCSTLRCAGGLPLQASWRASYRSC